MREVAADVHLITGFPPYAINCYLSAHPGARGGVVTRDPALRLPLATFTPDPARNRESARRLGTLPVRMALFGHGRSERDGARFRAFTAAF